MADGADPAPPDEPDRTAVETVSVRTDDGVRLAVHRLGPSDGTPVIMLPGTFSNHTFWLGTRDRGFAWALAEHGYRALVLDPRGHGASQRGNGWTFDDWARRDVPAVLRHAGSPAFLVGHSGGGAAALIALAVEPGLRGLARGVVVLATPLPWLQPWQKPLAWAIRTLSLLLGRFPARVLGLGPEDELPGVMAQWMPWNMDGRWRGDDGTDYVERIGELDVPVLGLAGAGDRLQSPPPATRALVELLDTTDRTFEVCGRDTGYGEDFDHAGLVVSRAAADTVWPRIIRWLDARDEGPRGLPAT